MLAEVRKGGVSFGDERTEGVTWTAPAERSGDGAFWNRRHQTPLTVPCKHTKAGSPLRYAPALQVAAERNSPVRQTT